MRTIGKIALATIVVAALIVLSPMLILAAILKVITEVHRAGQKSERGQ